MTVALHSSGELRLRLLVLVGIIPNLFVCILVIAGKFVSATNAERRAWTRGFARPGWSVLSIKCFRTPRRRCWGRRRAAMRALIVIHSHVVQR